MSQHALPILFLNLGGEMIYILDQRLGAQEIAKVKAQKVMNDIVGAMLHARFVDELFRPQELHSRQVLKQAFHRVAHASIMRLNETSMDKLYDLILMAVKHQTCACPRPSDLLLITLNHLIAMSAMVSDARVTQLVDGVKRQLIKRYGNMNESELQFVRYTLLSFFQDLHIRVSMFLRDESQNPNGRFVVPTTGPVPVGTEVSGSIRLFNANGELHTIKHFPNGGRYVAAPPVGADGQRTTKLGTNIYLATKTLADVSSGATTTEGASSAAAAASEAPSLAKEELDFLAQLIGCGNATTPEKGEFRLHLFDFNGTQQTDIESTKRAAVPREGGVKWTQTETNGELSRIMNEMHLEDKRSVQIDDNLLDLMDSACK